MQENPLKMIIEVMRKEGSKFNPPSVLLGEVLNPPPELIVKVNGIQIDKDNILVSDYLLNGYLRQYQTSGLSPELWSSTAQIKFIDTLKVGDTLAILPTMDRQKFIIISKVVSLK
jgi:hypothetical protein